MSCSNIQVMHSDIEVQSEIGGGLHLLTKEQKVRALYDVKGWSSTMDALTRKKTSFVITDNTSCYGCEFSKAQFSLSYGSSDGLPYNDRKDNVISKIILTYAGSYKVAFKRELIENVGDYHGVQIPPDCGHIKIITPACILEIYNSDEEVCLKMELRPEKVTVGMIQFGDLSFVPLD